MRKLLSAFFVICFVPIFVFAQNQPFDSVEKAVREQRGGFNGSKENLSIIFNQERIRLGDGFETELWKYLGNDVEKHYWIGFFLKSKSYLHGSQPLPGLTLKIWQNALDLLKDRQDKDSIGDKFKISVLSAVLAEKLGNGEFAKEYKNQSESIAASGFDTRTNFPFMSESEKCIYYSIGTSQSGRCASVEGDQPKEQIIIGGVLNGKAIKLARPKYPKEARKQKVSGQVWIKVLIDTNGKVILAEAVKGPPELFAVSIEAAKQSTFTPTTLSGQSVKVSGSIVYDFVR